MQIAKRTLRALFSDTFIWDMWERNRDKRQIAAWLKAGKPVPPPYAIKRKTISHFGTIYKIQCFVETGTLFGDTPKALKNHFAELFSIELSRELAERATHRFRKYPHIHIVQGDSGERLADVLSGISERCVFWLDGHYSAGITARADLDCPIIQELTTIFNHKIGDHVILIDDARHFDGTNDYPTIEQLRVFFAREKPTYHFSVSYDIIRAVPGDPVPDLF
jgi:hypothetical protein